MSSWSGEFLAVLCTVEYLFSYFPDLYTHEMPKALCLAHFQKLNVSPHIAKCSLGGKSPLLLTTALTINYYQTPHILKEPTCFLLF